MPTYLEEEDVEQLRRPCDALRIDLKSCLVESDCVKVHGLTPRDCLTSKDPAIMLSVPQHCMQLRQAFFECKRSLLDMRARFRGRKEA